MCMSRHPSVGLFCQQWDATEVACEWCCHCIHYDWTSRYFTHQTGSFWQHSDLSTQHFTIQTLLAMTSGFFQIPIEIPWMTIKGNATWQLMGIQTENFVDYFKKWKGILSKCMRSHREVLWWWLKHHVLGYVSFSHYLDAYFLNRYCIVFSLLWCYTHFQMKWIFHQHCFFVQHPNSFHKE